MQEHEYKARDKTVRKMSRDGLTEENLRSGETAFVSQREREERILSKQEEKICFSRLENGPGTIRKKWEMTGSISQKSLFPISEIRKQEEQILHYLPKKTEWKVQRQELPETGRQDR